MVDAVLKKMQELTNMFLNGVSDLSEAVDVYSDWIDACEAANQ